MVEAPVVVAAGRRSCNRAGPTAERRGAESKEPLGPKRARRPNMAAIRAVGRAGESGFSEHSEVFVDFSGFGSVPESRTFGFWVPGARKCHSLRRLHRLAAALRSNTCWGGGLAAPRSSTSSVAIEALAPLRDYNRTTPKSDAPLSGTTGARGRQHTESHRKASPTQRRLLTPLLVCRAPPMPICSGGRGIKNAVVDRHTLVARRGLDATQSC